MRIPSEIFGPAKMENRAPILTVGSWLKMGKGACILRELPSARQSQKVRNPGAKTIPLIQIVSFQWSVKTASRIAPSPALSDKREAVSDKERGNSDIRRKISDHSSFRIVLMFWSHKLGNSHDKSPLCPMKNRNIFLLAEHRGPQVANFHSHLVITYAGALSGEPPSWISSCIFSLWDRRQRRRLLSIVFRSQDFPESKSVSRLGCPSPVGKDPNALKTYKTGYQRIHSHEQNWSFGHNYTDLEQAKWLYPIEIIRQTLQNCLTYLRNVDVIGRHLSASSFISTDLDIPTIQIENVHVCQSWCALSAWVIWGNE
jgi:hypothetical protein